MYFRLRDMLKTILGRDFTIFPTIPYGDEAFQDEITKRFETDLNETQAAYRVTIDHEKGKIVCEDMTFRITESYIYAEYRWNGFAHNFTLITYGV